MFSYKQKTKGIFADQTCPENIRCSKGRKKEIQVINLDQYKEKEHKEEVNELK